MANSLAPAFGRIAMHTAYGIHTLTHQLFGVIAAGLGTQVVTADGTNVLASTVFPDLVDLFLPFFPTTAVFDSFTLFSKPTPADLPVPVFSAGFTGKIGTSSSPGWTKAVQTTTTWRTANVGLLKLVFLDSASGDTFDPILSAAADPSTDDLDQYMRSDDCIVSGQDNSRAVTFIRQTSTLNEKLRKQYRMG